MENLQKYIRENKNLVDTEMPGFGHFNRFSKKLDALHAKRKVFYLSHILRAAVAIIFIISVSVLLYNKVYANSYTLGDLSQEMNETQIYFETQLSHRYKKIDKLIDNEVISPNEIFTDLDEMDDYYKGLQKDMAENPNDERIVNAMIVYYQQKIELLDRILNMTMQYDENLNNTI
ncbi:MAG: hypothetical protein JXB49_10050 [Bacteroidales bacterium]|nr:hypothetical protein [Bacteroidales bacterium]